MTYILAQLIERYPDSLWERQNVVVAQAGNRAIRANTPGAADIRGCHASRYVELEVKTPTGKQTPEQRERQVTVTRAGGVYAVVRSLDEALAVVRAL